MTSEQILHEFSTLISDMAQYAYDKMPKPSVFSVEDFQQEGFMRAQIALQRWYKPNRGASARTYLYRALCSKFSDMIHASCKHVGKKPLESETEEDSKMGYELPESSFPSPIDILILEEKYQSLTEPEQNYIRLILEDGKTKTITRMAQIRRELNLNSQAEKELKQSIFEKILS